MRFHLTIWHGIFSAAFIIAAAFFAYQAYVDSDGSVVCFEASHACGLFKDSMETSPSEATLIIHTKPNPIEVPRASVHVYHLHDLTNTLGNFCKNKNHGQFSYVIGGGQISLECDIEGKAYGYDLFKNVWLLLDQPTGTTTE